MKFRSISDFQSMENSGVFTDINSTFFVSSVSFIDIYTKSKKFVSQSIAKCVINFIIVQHN